MKGRFGFWSVMLLLVAAPVVSVERVEIVLDASSGMWAGLGGGPPVFVSVRETLQDYAAAAALRQGRPEVALRIVGGNAALGHDDWCADTSLVAAFGIVDPQACRESLDDLVPRGGRPLVRGLEEAIHDLSDADDRRRIVIITSGPDQCHGDIIATMSRLLEEDPPIEIRIIGLGLDPALTQAARILAPTRNLTDPDDLLEALQWALQPADTRPPVASQLEMQFFYGATPLDSTAIELADATGSERAFSTIENGRARVQLAPGRYRAKIEMSDGPAVELAGLVVGDSGQVIEIHLSDVPQVTIDAIPEQPIAGGLVHIGFWGAPPGATWITLAQPDSSVGSYITRTQAVAGDSEVVLRVPENAAELEIRFVYEPEPGVFQLLGSRRLTTQEPSVHLTAPATVENGKPISISWTGPGHPGDHVSIAPRGAAATDYAFCLQVPGVSGSLTADAPTAIGQYVISYLSPLGNPLDLHPLEVFEVLATLDAPASVEPGDDLEIEWTGPDAPQDYLSIAEAHSPDDEYLSWSPVSGGNPAVLEAPRDPGRFEIRYVRSADGVVLARRSLDVIAVEVELQVPESVPAGTRFSIHWTGSAGPGDFLAVAEVGSDSGKSLDFFFASEGSPANLAAPFEPGTYEVRYVSGSGHEIVSAVPLTVQ